MKKLVVILLTLTMIFTFAACTPAADTTDTTATDAPATDAPATDAPATETPADTTDMGDTSVVEGKTVYFINAGPDDYYAQFGDAFHSHR